MAWRTSACLPKDQPRSFMRLLEQGPESQSASAVCSGGVSAVMGSSDLDAHTLFSGGASGNQLSCSLPFEAVRPSLEMACLDTWNRRHQALIRVGP